MMKPFKMILRGGLCLLLLSSGMAYGASWTTTRLTFRPGDSGSPKIAVSGSEIYLVWRDDTSGNDEIYFRKSINSGVAWQAAQRLTYNAGYSESPAIAVEGTNIYVVWENSKGGIYQIYFMKSEDGGDNWQAAQALTNNQTARPGKPAIAVEGANIYVVWQNDNNAEGGNCRIFFRKSANRGTSWQTARTLSVTPGSVDSRNPAIAAVGYGVYVVWEANEPGNNEIYFRKSTNNGAGWQAPKRLTTNSGASGSPAIAINGSSLYVVWEDTTPNNPEIYFMKSANKGATWQSSLRLTENSGHSHAPALALRGAKVYVVWNVHTPGNSEIYHRKSMNGGADWEDIERLTTNAGSSSGQAIAASASKIFVARQDATPGNNEIYLMYKQPAMDGITVLSPTASSVWAQGEIEKIQWRITEGAAGQAPTEQAAQAGYVSLTGLLNIDEVDIDLYDGSSWVEPIVPGTSAGKGIYSWRVPANLADGTKYKIRISCSTDRRIYKESAHFRIGRSAEPDLVVDSLMHSPTSPTTSNKITITAVVKNAGGASAGASMLSLAAGGSTTTHSIPALAAGAKSSVTRIVGPLSEGEYTVTAKADIKGAVVESNESNNVKTDTFRVTTTSVMPDLAIAGGWADPLRPTTLDTITITVLVDNDGGTSAGASTLSLLPLSGAIQPSTHRIPGLAAGARFTVTRSFGPLAAGTYPILVTVDANGEVAESSESNNTVTFNITVRTTDSMPDLVVSSLTGGIDGLGVYFTAEVKNEGGTGCSESVLGMTIKIGEYNYSQDITVGPLAPGASRINSSRIYTAVIPSGTYTLWAYADSHGWIPESNESNNTRSLTLTK